MPHHRDENISPIHSTDDVAPPDLAPIRKFQELQAAYFRLDEECAHAQEQCRGNREELELVQQKNRLLMQKHRGYLKVFATAGAEFEGLAQRKDSAERMRDEAMREVERLQDIVEEMKNQEPNVECKKTNDGSKKMLEELEACKNELKSWTLVSDFEKNQIEELTATIAKKNKTIRLLEKKVRSYKNWSEEISEDKKEWVDRAESLEGKVDHWRQIAQRLEQEKALKVGEVDIHADEIEMMLHDLIEVEKMRDLNESVARKRFEETVRKQFDEAVKKQVEKAIDENTEVQRATERIRQDVSLGGIRKVLDTQTGLNQKLSSELAEEQAIVKDRNERIQQLENMIMERDMQVFKLKNEAARKEKEARIAKKNELAGVDLDSSGISRRSI